MLLVIPTANIIHRQILNGVLRYAQQHGPWEFHMLTGLFDEQGIRRTREWGCDGAISFAETNSQIQAVLDANVPAVFINPPRSMLRKGSPLTRHCCALRDHAAVGRTGAEYFLERQYASFAYLGNVTNKAWSHERRDGYVRKIEETGYRCDVYSGLTAEERDDFALESRRLRQWLKSLPKPVALMAAHDRRARQVLDMCMDEGLSVPHEVAVLGVGNDEILCETTTPPLSSIEMDGENTGFDCACLLDGRMVGCRQTALEPCLLTLDLVRVVTRRSTETSCVADPLVARALALIKERIGGPLTVAEVAAYVNLSCRMLEIRAKKVMGRTVNEEIQRIRLGAARSMLRNTHKTVGEVADACGFYDASHLGLWFRKIYKITPTAFRASFEKKWETWAASR
ncbi:MAG: substrate-binding domain-containing protein [Kiritimatiellae bacterium]|nr:substrate-binding domain-containing protein [Kiritimatiellia bacterium]